MPAPVLGNTTANTVVKPVIDQVLRKNKYSRNVMSALFRHKESIGSKRIGNIGDGNNPEKSGAAIEQYTALQTQGGMDAYLPFVDRATRNPVSNAQVKNTSVQEDIVYGRVPLFPYRATFPLLTFMNKQKVGDKIANEYNRAVKASEHAGDWMNADLKTAFCYGYSANCAGVYNLDGDRTDLLATVHSHGNFFTPLHGQIDNSTNKPGTAGYETNLIAKLNELQVGGAGHGMSLRYLKYLKSQAMRMNIEPLRISNSGGGTMNDFHIIVMKDSALLQLEESDDQKQAQLHALERGWDNPIFTMARYIAAGFIIYVDKDMWGVQGTQQALSTQPNATLAPPAYGPYTVANPTLIGRTDSSNFPLHFVIGQGALVEAVAQQISYFTLKGEDDNGFIQEIGYEGIWGIARTDQYDNHGYKGSAGAWVQNQGSLIGVTATSYQLPGIGA